MWRTRGCGTVIGSVPAISASGPTTAGLVKVAATASRSAVHSAADNFRLGITSARPLRRRAVAAYQCKGELHSLHVRVPVVAQCHVDEWFRV